MYKTNNKGRKDITGERFNLLKVLFYYDTLNKAARWLCECECGGFKVLEGCDLRRGKVKSCGCLSSKHKMNGTRLYGIWKNMKSRCKDLTTHNKNSYFNKGITVCDEWLNDFLAFQKWAVAHGYQDNLTIDRIDGNKGYFPENCRWATRKQQQNNMSSNTRLTFQGETHTISEWSDITGLPAYLISSRIGGGWSDERALTTPINTKLSSKFRDICLV